MFEKSGGGVVKKKQVNEETRGVQTTLVVPDFRIYPCTGAPAPHGSDVCASFEKPLRRKRRYFVRVLKKIKKPLTRPPWPAVILCAGAERERGTRRDVCTFRAGTTPRSPVAGRPTPWLTSRGARTCSSSARAPRPKPIYARASRDTTCAMERARFYHDNPRWNARRLRGLKTDPVWAAGRARTRTAAYNGRLRGFPSLAARCRVAKTFSRRRLRQHRPTVRGKRTNGKRVAFQQQ